MEDLRPSWFYRRWPVILLLFLVLGPLGLPLLYKSPEFSRIEKVFWTLTMIVFTIFMIYESYAIIHWLVYLMTGETLSVKP